MFKEIKQFMSSDKNVSKFVFERASPMRFTSEEERNRPFVNLSSGCATRSTPMTPKSRTRRTSSVSG